MATFGVIAALTITTASITNGNGRKSAMVDNSSDKYQRIHFYGRFKCGTSPTAGTLIEIYGIREDDHATEYRTDSVAAGDVELGSTNIIKNAPLIGTAVVTGVTGNIAEVEGVFEDPGPGQWAIGFMNETAVTLGTVEADSFIHWVGEKAA